MNFSFVLTACNLVTDFDLSLAQLQQVTHQLTYRAFRPGTAKDHIQQADVFIHFCDHYRFNFLHPSISTICPFITHLIQRFQSSRSVHNYVSEVRVLHWELGLTPAVLDSFQVTSLL